MSQYPAMPLEDQPPAYLSCKAGNTPSALQRAKLVNCKTCWAKPDEICRPVENELQAKDPRVVTIAGWYHDSRFARSETLLGVPEQQIRS